MFRSRTALISILGLIVGISLVSLFLLKGRGAAANWYNDNWGFRRKITIDNTKVSGSSDLTNFPVLVSFSSDTNLSTNAKTDGSDILFVDEKGQQLTHEIEYYSAGTLVAWVRVPTLSTSVDTVLYMYYGNSSASGLENGTAVWSSDYRGVWHLSETSGQHQDSTTNNNDSTAVTVTTQGSATGKIGGADDFASGNEVIVADSDSLDITSSFTAEAWVKADTIGGSGTWNSIIYKGGNSNYFLELTDSDEIDAGFYGGGDWRSAVTSNSPVSTGTFYHVAVVHDAANDTIKAYVNGVEKSSVSSITQTPLTNTSTFTIGENFYNETFDGIIDEVRLSDSAKSVDWLLTQYNNQNSPSTFYSTGYAEERTLGPAAYWKFDEGNGTSVNDSSGNSIIGTIGTGASAPTWVNEGFCVSGNCLQYDGSDDYLTFGDNLDIEDGQDFTFTAWIKSNSFSTVQTVLAKKLGNSSGQAGYLINIGTGGTLNFYAADGTDQVWKGSSSAMSPNTWYHVAFVFDEDNASNISFYINGVATSGNLTGTLGDINSLANVQLLGIGVEPDRQYVFNGFIDEAKFYSYARSADEIKQDYLFSSGRGAAAVLGAQDSSFLSNGLVGYWKMDETTGTTGPSWTAVDSSGNGNNGTGAGDAGPATGKFGNGGSFDGTGDKITVSDSASLDMGNTATWSVWFKLDSLPSTAGNSYRLLDKWIGTGNQRSFQLYVATTDKLHMDIDPDGTDVLDVDIAGDNALVVGTWYHVAVVADGSQGYMYVNGVKQSDIENLSGIYSSTADLYIGSDTSSNYFDGVIDEVRIYKHILSASQVKALYEWAPGPVAYYDYNPTVSTTLASRVSASTDDAEEDVDGATIGAVDVVSSDLELTQEVDNQLVGMRFNNISIPQGAEIASAYVQFHVDETSSGTTNLTFHAEDSDNASTFSTTNSDLSNRTQTSASVSWNNVPAWNTVSEEGDNQKSPDIASVVQEVIDRPGWAQDNSIAILVTGTGSRIAESYDGESPSAPLLTINYVGGNVRNTTELPDKSSHGYTGALSNFSSTSFVQGKFGSGLSFNGTDSTITVTDTADLNFNGNSFTIQTWFNVNTLPSVGAEHQILVSKANDSGFDDARGWEIMLDKYTDKIRTRIWDNVNDGGSADGEAYSNSALSTNTWYHVAMVFETTTNTLSVYVNGIKQTETATVDASDHSNNLIIGAYNTSGAYAFSGIIDETKIYNYARTNEQILQDVNGGHPVIGTPVGSAVLQLSLSEGYGSIAHDISPRGNNGTLGTGSSAPSWTNDGKFGKALSFDGNDYLNVSDSDDFTFGNGTTDSPFTVSAWINTSDATQGTIVGKFDDTSGDQKREFLLYLSSSDYLTFEINDETAGGYIARSWATAFPENTWHHVLGVYDGSGVESGIKIYVDGVQKDDTSSSSGSFTAIQNTTSSVEIGAHSISATGKTYFFDGIIDEVKIYPFGLTTDQIQVVYNGGKTMVLGAKSTASDGTTLSNSAAREYCVPGDTSTCTPPIIEYTYNEGIGLTVPDTSGNNNNGVGNNITLKSGKVSKASNFSGNLGRIDSTNNSSITGSSAHTVCTWFKSVNNASRKAIVSIGTESTGGGYGVTITNSLLEIHLPNVGNTLTSTIDPTAWNHVCRSYTGTVQKLYVNGALISQETRSFTLVDASFHVGRWFVRVDGTYDYTGLIDQTRLYNYERTPAQIAWEYNRGAPVAHYKFDECQGSTAYNSALNGDGKAAGNNGTITIGGSGTSSVGNCSTSSTAWGNGVSGKINSSLDFDGTDDYVSTSDSSELSFGDGTTDKPFSVSAWIKMDDATDFQFVNKLPASGVLSNMEWALGVGVTDRLGLRLYDSSALVYIGRYSDTTLTAYEGQWVHVAMTYDGSESTNGITLYINGNEIASTAESAGSYAGIENTTSDLRIGTLLPSDATYKKFANGKVDDLRIYNYELTAAQIRNSMNNGAISFK